MSAMQRRKGATWERELAAYLRANGVDAQRGIGQARAASEVPDVDVAGWWIEAKRHARTNPKAALAQAIADSAANGDGRIPAAVCRDNGTGIEAATVTMRLYDWVELVKDRRDLESVCRRSVTAQSLEPNVDGIF